MYYYDVLGNALWGLLAGEFVPLPDSAIVSVQGEFADNDAGDDLMVQAGLNVWNEYGVNATLGEILQAIRDTAPALVERANKNHKSLDLPKNVGDNHIMLRSKAKIKS